MIGLQGKAGRMAGMMALALAGSPLAAQQSPGDYHLPGATVRPADPRSQGPVDADHPAVTQPVARPSETQAPVPVVAVTPAAGPTPAPRPTASRAMPSRALPQPQAGPTAPPAASPGASPAAPLPAPTAAPIPLTPPASTAAPGWYWPWIAGGAALAALVFAALWWRRRPRRALAVRFEPPVIEKPAAPLAPPPAPAAKPEPQPQSAAAPGASGLGIALEAQRMNASLIATTLNYRLTLTNHSAQPLSALAIEGDMVSAHASLPPERQVASSSQRLELRHALVALAPGESVELSGDFRLPLSAITPIRAGEAAYFVPLARLRVEASTASGQPLVSAQTYVVGEMPENPGAGLRPFRLDLGPRTYSRVGQRAVG